MKKLIIVCEEKLHRYGDFLAQLISESDDKEGLVVGIRDGAVAAQVWTEKEYSANAAQISSEQYLLFVGNSKLIKEKRHHMMQKYSEYGMNYGWLDTGVTLFGIVDQDYKLPEDVIAEMGLETFGYDTFQTESFEPESFSFDTFEAESIHPDTLGITLLRRGVIGVSKIGYLVS